MFKRGSVDARTAQELARLAGYELTLERCEILAPQLLWILEGASKLDALALEGVEPANFFQPSAWLDGTGERR